MRDNCSVVSARSLFSYNTVEVGELEKVTTQWSKSVELKNPCLLFRVGQGTERCTKNKVPSNQSNVETGTSATVY